MNKRRDAKKYEQFCGKNTSSSSMFGKKNSRTKIKSLTKIKKTTFPKGCRNWSSHCNKKNIRLYKNKNDLSKVCPQLRPFANEGTVEVDGRYVDEIDFAELDKMYDFTKRHLLKITRSPKFRAVLTSLGFVYVDAEDENDYDDVFLDPETQKKLFPHLGGITHSLKRVPASHYEIIRTRRGIGGPTQEKMVLSQPNFYHSSNRVPIKDFEINKKRRPLLDALLE